MVDKENTGPVRGSGNFLKDMGYEDPEEARVKFTLANNIALAIEDRRMTQAEAARAVGLAQSDISRIVNGLVKDYSVFRLMRVLTAFGKDISIGISDAAAEHGAIIAAETEPAPMAAPTP
jgi:predicted XRE-type DNA-binding protein